jgi:hypothetical protein
MKSTCIWVMTLCSLIEVHWLFWETFYLIFKVRTIHEQEHLIGISCDDSLKDICDADKPAQFWLLVKTTIQFYQTRQWRFCLFLWQYIYVKLDFLLFLSWKYDHLSICPTQPITLGIFISLYQSINQARIHYHSFNCYYRWPILHNLPAYSIIVTTFKSHWALKQ